MSYVNLFVCMSVHSQLENHEADLHQISVLVACAYGLVLLCEHYDTLCTSGFVDDVFS